MTEGQLTDLEQMLLLAVLRQEEDAYGASIQEDLEEEADRHVSLGTIYVTMGRLEQRGLASSTMGEPTGGRGGKARRLYSVTPAGRDALERSRAVWDRLWAGVPARGG